VHWIDTEITTPTNGVVFVDGTRCNGKVMYKGGPKHAKKLGVRTKQKEITPFQFADLQTTGP
jgi:hypothetical protein